MAGDRTRTRLGRLPAQRCRSPVVKPVSSKTAVPGCLWIRGQCFKRTGYILFASMAVFPA
jgi:hypothetical protein